MRNNVITIEMLEAVSICDQGVAWFRKTYPNGLKITKSNIAEAVTKLWKLKKIFSLDNRDIPVVTSLSAIRKDTDYAHLDTPDTRREKQREEKVDNTCANMSYGLDSLWHSVEVEQGCLSYRIIDLYCERVAEDNNPDGDLRAIINTVWSDIKDYRDYLYANNLT